MDTHGVSVLVVDDDKLIRQSLRAVIAGSGFQCVAVGSARAALQALQDAPFELVVADIGMPGEDGLWLLERIREGYPDTAVIMLTGVEDTQIAVDCLKLGASDYLGKPFRLEHVLASITKALDRRRLLIENHHYQRSLEEMVLDRTSELQRTMDELQLSNMATLRALSRALDARENDTHHHSQRVQDYTVVVGRRMGYSKDRLADMARGALLHDVGKIGISDRILLKPGKLTPEEWVEMRRHPEIGYQILRSIPRLESALRIVRYHHERWDGRGYPYGLTAEEIPQEARIFAVADAFDSMTANRVYRRALPTEEAIDELRRHAGQQFDPEIVALFLRDLDGIVAEAGLQLARVPATVSA